MLYVWFFGYIEEDEKLKVQVIVIDDNNRYGLDLKFLFEINLLIEQQNNLYVFLMVLFSFLFYMV